MESLFRFFQKFHRLSREAEAAIWEITRILQFKKNEILQPIGFTCQTIYFVKEGVARIFYYKDGNDITEHFAFEGSLIVRVESLFTGEPSGKGIQVLEDSEIIAIDAKKLFQLYDQYPEIERLFRLIFESEYVNSVRRVESLQFHSAKERYEALLLEKEIVKRIPLKYIASYLGITQVSLSRIRAELN